MKNLKKYYFFDIVFLHINANSELQHNFFVKKKILNNLNIYSESKKNLYDHIIGSYEALWEYIFKPMVQSWAIAIF